MSDTPTARRADIQIKAAVPTFGVPDGAATARWYAEHPGLRTTGTLPKQAPFAPASVQRDGAELMLLALTGYQKPDLSARRPEGLWDAYPSAAALAERLDCGRPLSTVGVLPRATAFVFGHDLGHYSPRRHTNGPERSGKRGCVRPTIPMA